MLANGYVGIGTTNPQDKFHVATGGVVFGNNLTQTYIGYGGGYANIELTGQNGSYIDFKDSVEDYDSRIAYYSGSRLLITGAYPTIIETNVGIGTTSASHKFRVQGFSHFSDGADYDNGLYGVLQITRASAATDNKGHISLVRSGQYVWTIGYTNDNYLRIGTSSTAGPGVSLAPGGTSWSTNSDERKKIIISDIKDVGNKLDSIRTVYYRYKNDEESAKRVGVIAQDLLDTFPETTGADGDGFYSVRYTELVPILIAGIKELRRQNEVLIDRLNALEAKIN